MSPWIPITVALIGAVVSIVAAVVASRGATKARKSAEALNSRAHRIARLDAEAEELREAYKAFSLSLGEVGAMQGVPRAVSAADVLASCQGATDELEEAVTSYRDGLRDFVIKGTPPSQDPTVTRLAYKAAQKIIADKREAEATDKD